MRRLLPIVFALALAPPAHADGLALRRVVLSTAGVGYYEFAGTAGGAAPLALDVKRAQVDDVLASLVVFDDAGRVGTVTLPGADAGQAAFAALPFGPDALASARAALNALKGVELTLRGPRPMTGRLLDAATATEPSGREGGIPRTRVTLLTADGLQQFVLEDADSVQVADPALRDRIAAALAALRGTAAGDLRRLTLTLPGSGVRMVRVGYVAAAPLWKATYRLLLPITADAPARLQAWAVLENDSAADWRDVDLTLQYGNPVTFRQALYRSYYVERPEVPLDVPGRILPGIDTRARTLAAQPAPAIAPPPTQMRMALAAPALAAPEPAPPPAEGVTATLFRLPTPVSLPAGQSATLPILDRLVPASRVGLVQQGRTHPLEAVRLINDTGASLPAGVLTLYDGADAAAFAGDARLGGLPPGESRLLAFAEDLRTGSEWHIETNISLLSVTAAQGVLHLLQRNRWTAHVTLIAPVGEARHLLVEIQKQPGGTLVAEDGVTPTEETATTWRFAVALHAGETRTLTIHVDRTTEEAAALLSDDRVIAGVLGTQGLTPSARAALQGVADLRAAVGTRRDERDRLTADREAVEHDEDRLRRNLAAVPASDALHGRLVQALGADEAQLAALATRIADADAAVRLAEAALQQAVLALRL